MFTCLLPLSTLPIQTDHTLLSITAFPSSRNTRFPLSVCFFHLVISRLAERLSNFPRADRALESHRRVVFARCLPLRSLLAPFFISPLSSFFSLSFSQSFYRDTCADRCLAREAAVLEFSGSFALLSSFFFLCVGLLTFLRSELW